MYSLIFVVFGFALISAYSANKVFGKTSYADQHVSISVIQALVERMDGMETREAEYKLEINGLRQELARQNDQIEHMQKKISGQDRLLSKLIRRVQHRSMSPLKVPQGSVQPAVISDSSSDRTRDVKEEIPVINTGNRIRRSDNEVMVAFTVCLTHSFLHAGPHQNIVFDHVETNLGNGYNSHHGVFIAPVSGLYLFYSSILSERGGEVFCQIVINGVPKASIYARASDNHYDQGSQSIVVNLQEGDDVTIQNYIGNRAILGNSDKYSTFSGVLLQKSFKQLVSIVG